MKYTGTRPKSQHPTLLAMKRNEDQPRNRLFLRIRYKNDYIQAESI
jgi:hypothetical protein